MSTKSKKSQQSSQQTPMTSTSAVQSPITPTRITRLDEKKSLANLNDRLAAYIERNQQLEYENNHMNQMIQKSEDHLQRTITRVTSTYENELIDARRMIDETAKERAKLNFDNQNLKKEFDELKAKFDKKIKDETAIQKKCTQLENQLSQQGTQIRNLQDELEKLKGDLKTSQDSNKELKADNNKLTKELDELRKRHDQEVFQKSQLEEQLKKTIDENNFKASLLESELHETKLRRVVELKEVDVRAHTEYESKLKERIQELRTEFETQLNANKEELDSLYEEKVSDLKAHLKRAVGSMDQIKEELASEKSKNEGMTLRFTSTISSLENERKELDKKVRELEKKIETDHDRYAKILEARDNDIDRLTIEKANQMNEYQALMDIKVALDNEIATYRKLLEGEEIRTGLSPSRQGSTPSGGGGGFFGRRSTPLRSAIKRKREIIGEFEAVADYDTTATTAGDIEIMEDDPEGKFVRLHNKGDKEVSLSGWILNRKAGDNETKHKFQRQAKLTPDAIITIWSSEVPNVVHEPSSSIVMKGQKWFTGDSIVTTLTNNTGEEMATRSSNRLRHTKEFKRVAFTPEDLLHQEGEGRDQGDRCIIF